MAPIKIKYSEQCIREAIRSCWWKHVGPNLFITQILLTVFLVYRIANGDRTWIVGVLGSVTILCVVIIIGSYIIYVRESLSQLRLMKVPEATLELEEEHFRITSDARVWEKRWSLIRRYLAFR